MFLSTLCSTTPKPVSATASRANSWARAANADAAASTIRFTVATSYLAYARAAQSARSTMARPRGTPAGSTINGS